MQHYLLLSTPTGDIIGYSMLVLIGVMLFASIMYWMFDVGKFLKIAQERRDLLEIIARRLGNENQDTESNPVHKILE